MIALETVAQITPKGHVRLEVYGASCYSQGIGLVGKVVEIEELGRWHIKLTNGYSVWADKIQRGV